jgi:hypothetical protein
MDISRDEAQESLNQVGQAVEQTKRMASYAGADTLFILWGLVWVLGCLGTQFVSALQNRQWAPLVGAGLVATFVVCRRNLPVKSPVDRRLLWFWVLLFVYAGMWVALLAPFLEVTGAEEHRMLSMHFWVLWATVAMFAYVVMGLWFENFMVWVGLAITGLTLVGLYLLQPVFWGWMAVTGGGTLLGTGLVIRRRWR